MSLSSECKNIVALSIIIVAHPCLSIIASRLRYLALCIFNSFSPSRPPWGWRADRLPGSISSPQSLWIRAEASRRSLLPCAGPSVALYSPLGSDYTSGCITQPIHPDCNVAITVISPLQSPLSSIHPSIQRSFRWLETTMKNVCRYFFFPLTDIKVTYFQQIKLD